MRLLNMVCCWLIIGLLVALAVAAVPDPNAADMDSTPRPDHATNPDWQGRSVVDGGKSWCLKPSQVTGEER